MKSAETQSEAIQRLQKQILVMQGTSPVSDGETVCTGLTAIEQAFPKQTFPTGAVHEFSSNDPEDGAATNGFLAGLMSCLTQSKSTCLWVSTRHSVFPPALKAFGIAPERVIFINALREKQALWTIEEALKCKALAAVVGEISHLDFTASRRLQLAVEQSRVTGFIHRYQSKTETPVACVSRWRITRLASVAEEGASGLGLPRWNVQLLKVRGGQPGSWQVEWTADGFRQVLHLASSLSRPAMRKTG